MASIACSATSGWSNTVHSSNYSSPHWFSYWPLHWSSYLLHSVPNWYPLSIVPSDPLAAISEWFPCSSETSLSNASCSSVWCSVDSYGSSQSSCCSHLHKISHFATDLSVPSFPWDHDKVGKLPFCCKLLSKRTLCIFESYKPPDDTLFPSIHALICIRIHVHSHLHNSSGIYLLSNWDIPSVLDFHN